MTIANFLSVLRMGIIPFFLMAMVYGHYALGLWLFITSGVTDALDGFIARFFNQKTPLGAFLDPMADKLMLTATYITLALPNIGMPYTIPVWLPIMTICRDVVIVLMALLLYLQSDVTKFPPSWQGKLTTFFQIAFAVACLLKNAYGFSDLLLEALLWTVVFFTVYSAVHYLWRARSLVGAKAP